MIGLRLSCSIDVFRVLQNQNGIGSLENEKKRCLVPGCVALCACCKNLEWDFLPPNKGFHASYVELTSMVWPKEKKEEGTFKITIQRCKFYWIN